MPRKIVKNNTSIGIARYGINLKFFIKLYYSKGGAVRAKFLENSVLEIKIPDW
jgi:hypothetical protein